MNRLLFPLLIIFLAASYAQSIENKKKELDSLRGGIKEIEQLLKQNKEQEKQTIKTIDLYAKQNYLLNKLINEISSTLETKNKNIAELTNRIDDIGKQTDSLKKGYSDYVVSVYKGMHENIWMYILSSESFTEAAYRYYMVRRITNSGKRTLAKLDSARSRLQNLTAQLRTEQKEQEELLADKSGEEKVLNEKLRERKELLVKIRKDNAALRKDLVEKKESEKKISSMIAGLIEEARRKAKLREEEMARKKREAEEKKSTANSKPPIKTNKPQREAEEETFADIYNLPGNTEFNLLKGKMSWPVKSGVIIRKFGENRNEKLNTITLNYGIDIKSKPDSDVQLVHDGVVSVIEWLPGYGSVVIVTHSKDYRTVYGHLGSINVKEGERLKKGTILGKVGESLEGYILHFQIWNDRNNQNPETWLARK